MKGMVGAFVVLALAGVAVPASAVRAAGAGRSREAYVNALVPVVEDEFVEDDLTVAPETYECVAEGYVDGFTLRRLRAIGSPAAVAKQRASHTSFARLGASRDQEARIVAQAILGCLPIGVLLKLGLQAKGKTLSDASAACITARFADDPEAADAYADASVRQALGKAPQFTAELARAGQLLAACLTPDELRAIQG